MIRFHKSMVLLAIAAAMPVCLSAQEPTTTVTPKSGVGVMTVESAQVVYVSGDDAVLKSRDGSLRLFELNPGTPLIIDGKEAQPSDLSPGMTVSHVQLHSRVTSDVTNVEEVSGTITAKNGRVLTLRLDDGTSKIYTVPSHATFKVDGKDTEYGNVMRGMKINVTAVTTSGMNTHSTRSAMVASTPPQQGTLVIMKR